jgi:hypothetical protein
VGPLSIPGEQVVGKCESSNHSSDCFSAVIRGKLDRYQCP